MAKKKNLSRLCVATLATMLTLGTGIFPVESTVCVQAQTQQPILTCNSCGEFWLENLQKNTEYIYFAGSKDAVAKSGLLKDGLKITKEEMNKQEELENGSFALKDTTSYQGDFTKDAYPLNLRSNNEMVVFQKLSGQAQYTRVNLENDEFNFYLPRFASHAPKCKVDASTLKLSIEGLDADREYVYVVGEKLAILQSGVLNNDANYTYQMLMGEKKILQVGSFKTNKGQTIYSGTLSTAKLGDENDLELFERVYKEDENYENIRSSASFTYAKPTVAPTVKPTVAPTVKPTVAPTVKPTMAPTAKPTVAPTAKPTVAPTVKPTMAPTVKPTVAPTAEPTVAPTVKPTVAPTVKPTVAPTVKPTVAPTAEPTVAPTVKPTAAPTAEPTVAPTAEPTAVPTATPAPVSQSNDVGTESNGLTVVTVRLPIAVTGTEEPQDDVQQKQISTKKTTQLEVAGAKYTITSASKMTARFDGVIKGKDKVKIRSTIEINGKKYKVTSIARNAFKNDKKVKYIVIPDTVKNIGANAFKGCTNLKKIVLPSNVTHIDKNVFKGVNKKVTAVVKKKTK